MKLAFICALVCPLFGVVIDGTVWTGDHRSFSVTNAISLVRREMRSRHTGGLICPLVDAHNVRGRKFWAGIVLVKDECNKHKALLFEANQDGSVKIFQNNDNFHHDQKNLFPSYSIDDVLDLYRKTGADVDYITYIESVESPTNVVWFIQASNNWIRIEESKSSAAPPIPSITRTMSTATRSR